MQLVGIKRISHLTCTKRKKKAKNVIYIYIMDRGNKIKRLDNYSNETK